LVSTAGNISIAVGTKGQTAIAIANIFFTQGKDHGELINHCSNF
jgi:hypothetical protein